MSTNTPWENEDGQNYIYMQHVVKDVVKRELRVIFIKEWNSRYEKTCGAWDDTSSSGQELFQKEKTRKQPSMNLMKQYLAKFQHGDTKQWDCSVLFDAILFSNSIGKAGLNPLVSTELKNLQRIRNEIVHSPENKMSDVEFQTKLADVENAFISLGCPVIEIQRIRNDRNRYKSFQFLPPKPSHELVDRCDKIAQIIKDLRELYSNNPGKLTYFYIHGNPGSGKSQLAGQVCETLYKDTGLQTTTRFVMTLDGKELSSLLSSYEVFCRRLNCDEIQLKRIVDSTKPISEKIKDLKLQLTKRIRNWKRWWLIVDNVENLETVSPLLPQRNDEAWSNGQIVLTVQNTTAVPSDGEFTKHISLSPGMNDQESRQLLNMLSKTSDNDSLLNEVAEKLDRQPLAMAAAAVYVRQVIETNLGMEFGWLDYLKKLERGKRKITEKRLQQVNPAYSSTMSTAVLLAAGKCAENIVLNRAFYLFSLISFQQFPLDLIVKYIQQYDKELEHEDICLEISQCSLFLPAGDHDIRLHRVVHEAIKTFCHSSQPEINDFMQSETLNGRTPVCYESLIGHVLNALSNFKDRADKIKLIPHLEAFHTVIQERYNSEEALHFVSLSFEKTEISDMFLFFGEILHYHYNLKLSEKFLNSALKVVKDTEHQIHLSDVYTELGSLHNDLGNQKIAKDYHHRAMEIRQEKSGPRDLRVADSYNHLGTVYHDEGDLEKAEEYYEQALEICKDKLGSDEINVAQLLNNLGVLFSDTERPEKAKDYYERALEIEKAELGPKHIEVAGSYHNLGTLCSDNGELEQAMEYLQLALEIEKSHYGPGHIDVADTCDNIGTVYHDLYEVEKAEDYYQQALQIRKAKLGPNHVDVAKSYNNLGVLLSDTGRFQEAKDHHEWALEIEKEKFGPNHIEVADSCNNLSAVYSECGELEKALDCSLYVLNIRKEQSSPNPVDVCSSYSDIGLLYDKIGDFEKAEEYHKKALEIQEEQLGPSHVGLGSSLNINLGLLYSKTGDYQKAEDYLNRGLEIQKEHLGANHVNVGWTYNKLGLLYVETGDYQKAENYLNSGLEIRKEQLGENHVDVSSSYHNLSLLYTKTGNLQKAEDYFKKAEEIWKQQ